MEEKKKSSRKSSTESTAKITATSTDATALVKKMTEPDEKVIKDWADQDRKMIMYWCHDRISELKAARNKELATCLALIQDFIGIKSDDQLEGLAEDKMIRWLKEHYLDFGIKELDYAFDLAGAKKLEGINYERNSHLPLTGFSAGFIGNVLDAYRKARSRVLLRYQNEELKLLRADLPPQPEINKEEIHRDLSFLAWDNWKRGAGYITKADTVYDFLKGKDLIPEYPEDRWATFKDYARVAINKRREPHIRGLNRTVGSLAHKTVTPSETDLEFETKKVALITYFQSLDAVGTTLMTEYDFKTSYSIDPPKQQIN